MATTFQVKRSSVAGKVPNTSTLSIGELGLNLTDQVLYSSNGTGVFELGANVTNQTVKTSLLIGNSSVNTTINSSSISISSIIANGSVGTNGQILVSNGSTVYWNDASAFSGGTVTQIDSGNGLTGGPITATGTLSVLANTGLIANSTGLYVNSAYIATLASNSATYANSSISNTFTVGTSTYFVANGNVGIGNTSPTSKLHVEGNAYVSGNTQLGTAVFFKNSDISSSTISQLNGTNAPAMQLKRYTSRSSPGILLNSIWFTSSAINQTTASTGSTSVELDSNNVLAQQNLTNPQTYRIYGTYTDASNYERLSLSSNSTASYIQAESAGTGTARPLYLGANNSTAMTVAANSNIGIGTTSPTSPLHIRSSGISWKHDSITHGHLYTQFINSGGQAYFTIRTDNGTPSLRFETSGKDILLLPASNVGIGNTSPTEKLHVQGNILASGNVTATAFSGNGSSITSVDAATVGGNTAATLRSYSDSTAATAYSNAISYASNASNLSTGTVSAAILGSGTANSTTYLAGDNTWQTVSINPAGSNTQIQFNDSGSFGASAGLTFDSSANNLSVANTVSATHFDNVSDVSLKDNILTISNSLDILNNLNPVSFNWKESGEKSFGLIAQEVESILPEIVHSKSDDVKTVSYIQLIPFLIHAIKQQNEEIRLLKEKLQ